MTLSNPRITDQFGNTTNGPVNAGKQIQVVANLTNNQLTSQPFTYLVQINDQNGVTVSLSWISGTLTGHSSLNPAQSWTPTSSGTYTAQIFVFQSINNPVELSPPLAVSTKVMGGGSSNYNTTSVSLAGHLNHPIPGENVTLMIFSPLSNPVQVSQAVPDNNGDFTTAVEAGGPLFNIAGAYNVKIVFGGITQNNLSFYCNSVSPINCSSNSSGTPVNASDTIPHRQIINGSIIAFPKVIHYYDDGTKFYTDPRPYDDYGSPIPTRFLEGTPVPKNKLIPPQSLLCNALGQDSTMYAQNVVHQEGGSWNQISPTTAGQDGAGYSINWTMPTGTATGLSPQIFFNPVNFFYNDGSIDKFFQVDFGLTQNLLSGWFYTVLDEPNDQNQDTNQFNKFPVQQGTSYRVDAWLETGPNAYPPAYVVKITYYNTTANQLQAVQLKPKAINFTINSRYIQNFQSFNDQYLTWTTNDVTVNGDKYMEPFVGVFIDTGNSSSNLIGYDSAKINGFSPVHKPRSSSQWSTVKMLEASGTGNEIDDSKICASSPRITRADIEPHYPSLKINTPSIFTVTVTDDDFGPKTSPAGKVNLTSTATGIFNPNQCRWDTSSSVGTSNTCTVTYTPTSEAPAKITAMYNDQPGNEVHGTSSDITESSIPILRTTQTVIEPHTPNLSKGNPTTFKVTVTDDDIDPKTAPVGTVTLSSSGVGNFNPTQCNLDVSSSVDNSNTCNVTYTPSSTDSTIITANYTDNPASQVHYTSSVKTEAVILVPEFGSVSIVILLISFISIIVIAKIKMKSLSLFEN
jgi:predicted secreted protein with PEFG-CTERM motif